MPFRQHITEALAELTEMPAEEIDALLETPPARELGDVAFPCFALAKSMRKAPHAIAQELSERLAHPMIARSEPKGPYLNIFYRPEALAEHVLNASPKPSAGDARHMLLEFPSPNTNKPLHLGHLRNMLLGETLARVAEASGERVTRTNLYNDRGVHICKSMLAYTRWGEGSTPVGMGLKSDHFVGHWYVEFAKRAKDDESLEEEAQEMLRRWEAGDPEVRALWETMNEWAYRGYLETFERLGLGWDKHYYESDIYTEGKGLVEKGLKDEVFERDEKGNVRAPLGGLGEPVVLRADGTAVYMTQDLHLAQARQDEWSPDAQVYVVGEEQTHRFKQLFAILQAIGMERAEGLYHLSYGLISLPEGRMKSREGTVVDVDDLLDEMETLAAEAVRERHPDISDEAVLERARVIGHGALRYFILKYDPKTSFVYNPKESLSFEGETGPYVQYAAARISSILSEGEAGKEDASALIAPEEQTLLAALAKTSETITEAAQSYKPHLVARHAMAVAQAFTAFYHACRVLDAPEPQRSARLALLRKTREHLEYLLLLLGIETLEEM